MKIQIINDIIKKYKAKIIVAVIITILIGLIALLFNLWQNAITESKRKDTIILTKTKEYYTKDSLKVIEVTQQQMTIKEYEELKFDKNKILHNYFHSTVILLTKHVGNFTTTEVIVYPFEEYAIKTSLLTDLNLRTV